MTTPLPRGVTRTAAGWRITIRRKGQPLWQKRFPPSTPQATVETALETARLRRGAGRTLLAGSLEADIQRYLTDYFAGHPGHAERKRHLELWADALGETTLRASLTRDDIARVLSGWRAHGLAAETCNKRRTALLALYHALDGKGASNPVREIPKYRAPAPLPRGLAYTAIEKALRTLPICKTRARLAVLAYTGLRAGQLMKLTPDAWNREAHVLLVPGTTKGRGTKPYALPLSDVAETALKLLDHLEAWGRFATAPAARMWKAAAIAAGLPPTTKPYDLRHSFATVIFQTTGDLKTTKELLGHSSLRTTERYMIAAVPARMQDAIHATFGQAKAGPATKTRVASRQKRRAKTA